MAFWKKWGEGFHICRLGCLVDSQVAMVQSLGQTKGVTSGRSEWRFFGRLVEYAKRLQTGFLMDHDRFL